MAKTMLQRERGVYYKVTAKSHNVTKSHNVSLYEEVTKQLHKISKSYLVLHNKSKTDLGDSGRSKS